MRTGAKVNELVACPVNRDVLAARFNRVNPFLLILVALKKFASFLGADFLFGKGQALIYDALHLGFQFGQVVNRNDDAFRHIKVTVKAVLGSWSHCHLNAWEKVIHSLCQDVFGRMADVVELLFLFVLHSLIPSIK